MMARTHAFASLLAIAALALQGCSTCPTSQAGKPDDRTITFDPNRPIYGLTATGDEALTLDDYERRLPTWLAGGARAVLFVHGRGDEPTKSVRGMNGPVQGRALQCLTNRGLRPLMFNWDSKAAWMLDRKRPQCDIPRAAQAFAELLQVHARLRRSQPDLPKPVLLVHSMGALVIQQVVEQNAWPEGGLFERIVFSEPDANENGHELWLTPLAKQEHVWVTWNGGDLTLNFAFSGREKGERALGLGVPQGKPLAPNVCYLNLSLTGAPIPGWLNHTVFVEGSFGHAPTADRFIGRLLSGDPIYPYPNRDSAIQSRDDPCVIRLNP